MFYAAPVTFRCGGQVVYAWKSLFIASVLDKVGDEGMGSEASRRLPGLVAIRGEGGEQVDEEIDWAAVTGMFDLANVLELINDRLDERALAQQEPVGELVGELDELVAHIPSAVW